MLNMYNVQDKEHIQNDGNSFIVHMEWMEDGGGIDMIIDISVLCILYTLSTAYD